ncbi:MAG: S9 family peptidase [Myxococcota bacterium]
MCPVPLDELVRLPLPGMGGPVSARFVGDRHLTWLESGPDSLVQHLWSLDLGTGEVRQRGTARDDRPMPLEEVLRRERLRERALGVTSYRHAAGGRVLVVPRAGAVWVERSSGGPALGDALEELIPGPVLEPVASPDGTRIAYVADAELYVVPVEGGPAVQLTTGARGTGRTHGLAEYVAEEEMNRRSGFWWSPDGQWIAYTEVDDRHVPVWRIVYQGQATPTWEDHRYPFAGADNARVRLFVVRSTGGEPVELALGDAEYLARVGWMPDGTVVAQVQDRRQKQLRLLKFDVAFPLDRSGLVSGRPTVVLTEEGEPYVELNDLFRPLDLEPGAFLWGSERTGYLHLYKVDAAGGIAAVTHGDWVVDELVAVDEPNRRVYVTGTLDGACERHLYAVSLDGGPPRRLTPDHGIHTVAVDLRGQRFVDTWSAVEAPPRTVVRDLNGAILRTIDRATDPRIAALGLTPPELLTVTGAAGDVLHAALYRPDGDGPFPTVVFVYGGPHAQRVTDSWDLTIDLRAQHLRSLGIAVLRVDNRGSGRRGRAFAAALYGETGRVELDDQVAAVRELVGRGVIDPARVGITGWSYGGYMTLMAMFRAPDVFRVGVAGAPVTHWDGYDTHYTERYMGLPSENPDGYAQSSVLTHVDGLRGELMVVHGMLDENVHFRHTGRLINALVAARKPFELQVFPDERHMPRKPADRLYLEQKIVGFLRRHLGVADPSPSGA